MEFDSPPPARPDVYVNSEVPHCTPVEYKDGRKVCGPSFLLFGQQKGGSTAMFWALTEHPAIKSPKTKELKFFSNMYDQEHGRMDKYWDMFPDIGMNVTTGEGSVSYFNQPWIPAQLSRELPNIRLIATLRDPVDRAWSHYDMAMRLNWTHDGVEKFGKHVRDEIYHLNKCFKKQGSTSDVNYPQWWECWHSRRSTSEVAMGHYAIILKHWFKYFPRNQFLILKADDYFNDPYGTLDRITDFLDLKRYDWKKDNDINLVRNAGRHKESMQPEDRETLTEYFRPFNEDLGKLLGPEFNFNINH